MDLMPVKEAEAALSQMVSVACTCPSCVGMCERRPCWPTPEDAKQIIAAGFGARLMKDWWVGGDNDTRLLSPAIVGYGGRGAPQHPVGRCTFLTAEGMCELHALGLKPTEGRIALGCKEQDGYQLHLLVASTWQGTDPAALLPKERKGTTMRKLIAVTVLAVALVWAIGAAAHPHPTEPCHMTEGCKGGPHGGK